MDWILMITTVALAIGSGSLGYYHGFTRGFRHGQWDMLGELIKHADGLQKTDGDRV